MTKPKFKFQPLEGERSPFVLAAEEVCEKYPQMEIGTAMLAVRPFGNGCVIDWQVAAWLDLTRKGLESPQERREAPIASPRTSGRAKRPGNEFSTEAKFTAAVLKELRKLPGCYFWRNNTGGWGRVRYGDRGSPDILGFVRGGRFAGVETKMPGEELRPEQEIWIARAIEAGALIVVADNLPDAIRGVIDGMA